MFAFSWRIGLKASIKAREWNLPLNAPCQSKINIYFGCYAGNYAF